ncbi:MAG: 50S ribosomal protein L9 [Lentisphaerae bacterium GWF2_45_14]|nr:MAG: 50S ribosomal protein L9 [Lentisphaerae bacterium GWF2_45_14]
MASVKLILLEDVENVGLAGAEISVSSGYARNFLLPRKLAAKASPGALRAIEARRGKIEENRKVELAKASEMALKFANSEVVITMEAADDDQLYGAVNARMIAEKLAENGIEVPYQKIKLDKHIKQLGSFEVEAKLHPQIKTMIKVKVARP